MAHKDPEHPTPKIPAHPATSAPASRKEKKIDHQVEDTFPASDPPSFSGGNHIVGAPKDRESEPVTGQTPAVKDAEKKAEKR